MILGSAAAQRLFVRVPKEPRKRHSCSMNIKPIETWVLPRSLPVYHVLTTPPHRLLSTRCAKIGAGLTRGRYSDLKADHCAAVASRLEREHGASRPVFTVYSCVCIPTSGEGRDDDDDDEGQKTRGEASLLTN